MDKKLVFVPNKGPHDYTDAYRFGDLIFCTSGPVNRKDLLSMYNELNRSMAEARKDDYILLTSLTSLCSIACSLFAFKFGKLNLLIFEDGEYLSRTLTFNEW